MYQDDDTTTAIATFVDPTLQHQVITTRNMKAIVKSCVKVS